MTPHAIRQFIAICGGDCLAKGSRVVEPERGFTHPSYIMGQSDYIIMSLRFDQVKAWSQLCPFEPDTRDAELWAQGKLHERKSEAQVIGAYAHAAKMGRTA